MLLHESPQWLSAALTDIQAFLMQPEKLFESANSYFGLLRQATHSHVDRVRLAKVMRRHGYSVNGTLTKTWA